MNIHVNVENWTLNHVRIISDIDKTPKSSILNGLFHW